MIEVARAILEERGRDYEMYFSDLVNAIQEYLDKSDAAIRESLPFFYSDLNTDGSFIPLGENKWGLRSWYAIDEIDEEIITLEDDENGSPKRKKKRVNAFMDGDEDAIDYSDDEKGMIDICLENDRVIIFRSFSKKFLASGYRTGYMVTTKKIEGLRNTIIPPHSVTSYSENFFVSLLNDKKILTAFVDTREYIKTNRDLIYDSFKNIKSIKIIRSDANFISIIFDDNKLMNKIYDSLSDLSGIQKFDEVVPFIKIWVNNEKFSQEIIKRIRKIII